jgi:hypothetical protein
MSLVLCRPWSDEAEDYMEYNRIRREQRMRQGLLCAHVGGGAVIVDESDKEQDAVVV